MIVAVASELIECSAATKAHEMRETRPPLGSRVCDGTAYDSEEPRPNGQGFLLRTNTNEVFVEPANAPGTDSVSVVDVAVAV
jgi:hypothetical protein